MNRTRKDVFYMYKALYNKQEAFVHIATRDWPRRWYYESDSIPVLVVLYANQSSVSLKANGKSVGTYTVERGMATATIAGLTGKVYLEANAGNEAEDRTELWISKVPMQANKISQLCINAGTDALFEDQTTTYIWMPDVAYRKGGCGYKGGTKKMYGERVGSVIEIKGTKADPLDQTCRVNPEAYTFDVQDGMYEIEIHFVKYGNRRGILNDIGENKVEKSNSTAFSAFANGIKILDTESFEEEYGLNTVVKKVLQVEARGGKGVDIQLDIDRGEIGVSAVRIQALR